MKMRVDKILELNGIVVDKGTTWKPIIPGKQYRSTHGETINIYKDKIVYFEDIRCGHLPQTVNLNQCLTKILYTGMKL